MLRLKKGHPPAAHKGYESLNLGYIYFNRGRDATKRLIRNWPKQTLPWAQPPPVQRVEVRGIEINGY